MPHCTSSQPGTARRSQGFSLILLISPSYSTTHYGQRPACISGAADHLHGMLDDAPIFCYNTARIGTKHCLLFCRSNEVLNRETDCAVS